jgi:putative ABC transport system permease protein
MSLAPFAIFALSARSLLANPLRSALTSLGVFMGVAAVNATLQVGNINQTVIAKQLATRDAPQLIVTMTFTDSRSLQLEDMKILKQQMPELPAISASIFVDYDRVTFADRQAEAAIEGVSADYLRSSGRVITNGF